MSDLTDALKWCEIHDAPQYRDLPGCEEGFNEWVAAQGEIPHPCVMVLRPLIPELWTDADRERHLEDCSLVIDVTKFGDSQPRHRCGCGEASRHTPWAVARAELDALTTRVDP